MESDNACGYSTHKSMSNFTILQHIGEGGFGQIVRVRSQLDGNEYAIKRVLIPDKLGFRERIIREVNALKSLKHRNIVNYFDHWEETQSSESTDKSDGFESERSEEEQELHSYDFCGQASTALLMSRSENLDSSEKPTRPLGSRKFSKEIKDSDKENLQGSANSLSNEKSTKKTYLYIQMELCKDKNLYDFLHSEQITKEEKTYIFGEILDAVEYMHENRIFHRDLKPKNIFFALNGTIKVGDFGLVKGKFSNEPLPDSVGFEEFKNHSPLVGTNYYMSPEQWASKPYNYKVDIYALGVIWVELILNFKTEHERGNTLQYFNDGEFPPYFSGNYPQEYEILCDMLSQDPEVRPTVSEVKRKIRHMYKGKCDLGRTIM